MSDLTTFMAEVSDIWTQTVKQPFANRKPTEEELDTFLDRVMQLVEMEKSYGHRTNAD